MRCATMRCCRRLWIMLGLWRLTTILKCRSRSKPIITHRRWSRSAAQIPALAAWCAMCWVCRPSQLQSRMCYVLAPAICRKPTYRLACCTHGAFAKAWWRVCAIMAINLAFPTSTARFCTTLATSPIRWCFVAQLGLRRVVRIRVAPSRAMRLSWLVAAPDATAFTAQPFPRWN